MISLEKCEAYLTSAKPWERKANSRCDERPRLWPSAMPGSR